MHYRRTSKSPSEKMAPCGCCTLRSVGTEPQIDESEVCMGKGKRRKLTPKKDKCPVNRTHEWYKEWVEEDYCWPWLHSATERKIIKVHRATCIHCRKVKVLRKVWPPCAEHRTLRLPKRPVKF